MHLEINFFKTFIMTLGFMFLHKKQPKTCLKTSINVIPEFGDLRFKLLFTAHIFIWLACDTSHTT